MSIIGGYVVNKNERLRRYGVTPFSLSGESKGFNFEGVIEKIRNVQIEDISKILQWASDPETRRHLDPAPDIPKDWNNPDEVRQATQKLELYYRNQEQGSEQPRNITPLVAVDKSGNPVGVLTIRWRGDPYVPRDKRIASIERLIIDPNTRNKGIGTQLLSEAIELCCYTYTGYSGGNGAREVRLWVMSDKEAGDYTKNINFFRRFGFQVLAGNWKEYAAKRGIDTNRDAMWFSLKQEDWEAVKEKNTKMLTPEIILPSGKIDLVNVRL